MFKLNLITKKKINKKTNENGKNFFKIKNNPTNLKNQPNKQIMIMI